MLKDAALLHLELLAAALVEDVVIKDGTAYNIQWRGTRPVFIDVASFERLSPGHPWAGYRQFCQTFLFPLMMQAYKNVPFQPWLRGRLNGISPQECRNVMSFRDLFRRGVATHVFLHAWLDARQTFQDFDVLQDLPAAGFGKEQILRNVDRLIGLVRRLEWSPPESAWSGYADANTYAPADQRRKEDFVRNVTGSRRWKLIWDLGCNTGTYSRIAAENADCVVALDADQLAAERFYQALKNQPDGNTSRILPLVSDLVDAPGGQGWRGAERKALVDRGRPELTLCLALIHHLVIAMGVPLPELIDWLAGLTTNLIIEFVSKEDPMVRRLLRGRRDNYSDYEPDVFERVLNDRFDVVRSEPLASGTRTLYYAAAKAPP
jgi:ribosomal protein L11 methylase PrmA